MAQPKLHMAPETKDGIQNETKDRSTVAWQRTMRARHLKSCEDSGEHNYVKTSIMMTKFGNGKDDDGGDSADDNDDDSLFSPTPRLLLLLQLLKIIIYV